MLRWFIRILVSLDFCFLFFSDFSFFFFYGERERREREEMKQCVSSRNDTKLLTFVKKVMTIPFVSMSGCHSKRKNGMATFSVKEEVVT